MINNLTDDEIKDLIRYGADGIKDKDEESLWNMYQHVFGRFPIGDSWCASCKQNAYNSLINVYHQQLIKKEQKEKE
jgi:hypothetical protein